MPFRSKAQNRWMRWAEAKGKLKKGTAHRWAHETPGGVKNLPEFKRRKKSLKKGHMFED